MIYSDTSYTNSVEIMCAGEFKAVPITLTGTDVVKAGTPITAAGAADTASCSATAGILLYDVDCSRNPNGAIVVEGLLDLTKAKASSGLALTASAIQTALPGVICRTI